MNETLLDKTFLDIALNNWLIFLGATVTGVLFKGMISRSISHLIFLAFKKAAKELGRAQFDTKVKKPLEFIIVLIAIYIGAQYIDYPKSWGLAPSNEFGIQMIVKDSFYILLVYGIIWLGMKMAEYLGDIFRLKAENTESKLDDQLVPFLVDLIKVLVVIIGLLIILADVFNVNIATLIAGLGIGGLALAMASKDSLENLLGSFTIFFDQPFKLGDFVKMGGTIGSVEKVGFRSTRIRTADKTYVTIPNRNVISSEVDNYSERTHRRSRFFIGLTYSTNKEQLQIISKEILAYLLENPKTTNDPIVRFNEFGASSLNLLVQYLAYTTDYQEDLELKEEINYKIMEIVAKHNAEFAFPSQSLYIENLPNKN